MHLQAQLIVSKPLPAAAVDATDARFAGRAVQAHAQGLTMAPVLRIAPPSLYAGLGLLALVILSALTVAVWGSVEVTARGRGALRAADGTMPIVAEVAGPIVQIAVRSGDRVQAGQLLMRIEAAPMMANLAESDRRLQFLEGQGVVAHRQLDTLNGQRQQGLNERAALLQQRIAQQQQILSRSSQRKATYDELKAKGFISDNARDDVLERNDDAMRLLLSLKDELTRVRGETTQLDSERQLERLRWSEDRDTAAARSEAARMVLRQSRIVAPQAGVVEALAVRSGEQVMPGMTLAKLVPSTTPNGLVAFIEERERAFLVPGAPVHIEIDQWPAGEFGALQGSVKRIASDIASTEEMREVLGESANLTGAYYRVDVAVLPARVGTSAATFKLRPGMRVTVRFKLRERRLITFVLEPLKKWLQ